LIVEPLPAEDSNGAGVSSAALKYCPVCHVEYASGFELCTVCGAALVSAELRGRPLNEKSVRSTLRSHGEGAILSQSATQSPLCGSGIQHHVQATMIISSLNSPCPARYIIRVFASDLPKVKELLTGIKTVRSSATRSVRICPKVATGQRCSPGNLGILRQPRQRSGRGRRCLGEVLEDCFQENRIPCRRQDCTGEASLLRPSSDESAAREIIREVTEATPPT